MFIGENAIPAAVDILRIALFSAQNPIKKAAESVLNMMSPEFKKIAADATGWEMETTPMPKAEIKLNNNKLVKKDSSVSRKEQKEETL